MTTYSEKQRALTKQFSAISDTPALDANCIIGHVTKKSTAKLITASDTPLSPDHERVIDALASAREAGTPIAYLVGEKSFWTLDLIVTSDTLIPRPETECLVQWILDHFSNATPLKIADLGTGSGAIALALALARPRWTIHATDQSKAALNVAKQNAKKYHLNNVCFYQGNWCDALPKKNYDLIVSNPPYIADDDPHLIHLSLEPKAALTAGCDGLDAIRAITQQAKLFLKPHGVLVIEHGYHQANAVHGLFEALAYGNIVAHKDLSGVPRYMTAYTH